MQRDMTEEIPALEQNGLHNFAKKVSDSSPDENVLSRVPSCYRARSTSQDGGRLSPQLLSKHEQTREYFFDAQPLYRSMSMVSAEENIERS